MSKIFIDGQVFILDRTHLIQSGGEGLVFALGKSAVKIYHRPSPAQVAKLQDWMDSGLGTRLPPNLLGPERPAFDEHQQLIGFQMPLLPAFSQPFKKLGQPTFWKQHDIRVADVIQLFRQVHATLSQIHNQGVIVGDLNDTNLFFLSPHAPSHNPALNTFWIDVDSYQFGRHPCPVAKETFLAPELYGVSDLGRRAYFTTLTDWYAYLTLLVQSLLQVHPFGGVHHRYKTIQARAEAGISLLSADITYPKTARPLDCLNDDLLHHIHLVYERRQRMPFPRQLLEQYEANLVNCQHCGLAYPIERTGCPLCRRVTPAGLQARSPTSWHRRLLLKADGYIAHMAVLRSGQVAVVIRRGESFSLSTVNRDGRMEMSSLFTGRINYRFGSFEGRDGRHHLVVNPPGNPRLLLLDTSGARPRRAGMLETGLFRGEAVFATTSRYLYRIAGNWIMRGCVQDGHFMEEPIATAHRAQTQIWGSPASDIIAGYHRVFAERHYFLIDSEKAAHPIPLPALALGESISETHMAFSKKTVAIFLLISQDGRERIDVWISDLGGKILHRSSDTDGTLDTFDGLAHLYPYSARPADPSPPFILLPAGHDFDNSANYRPLPNGLLIQHSDRLYLISKETAT